MLSVFSRFEVAPSVEKNPESLTEPGTWKTQLTRLLLLVAVLSPLALIAQEAQAAKGTEIRVPIVGVRNSRGSIFVALYDRDHWLKPHRFVKYTTVKAYRGSVYASFHGVRPGRYGIAVFHDENRNGVVDTNVLGLPKEGYGFSRKTPLRKPRFEEVAFEVRPLGHAHVRLRY